MKLYILSLTFILTFSSAVILPAPSKILSEEYQEKDKKKKGEKKKNDPEKKGKKSGDQTQKKNPKISRSYNSSFSVTTPRTWTLPATLHEISGITFIDEQNVACVQDETGEIFVYNLPSKKITKSIPFAGPGDYEGIALVKGYYYVLRSDGMLLKVDPSKPSRPEYFTTSLTVQNNCEGLHYDQAGNRLLIAVKGLDPTGGLIKGIYSFDLSTGKFIKKPIAHIDLEDPHLSDTTKKKDIPQRRYHPSDIALDPQTKDLLIVNGVNSSLMILGKDNRIKTIISLDKKTFPQPEGIAYSPSGKLYISSEGASGLPVIAECVISEISPGKP